MRVVPVSYTNEGGRMQRKPLIPPGIMRTLRVVFVVALFLTAYILTQEQDEDEEKVADDIAYYERAIAELTLRQAQEREAFTNEQAETELRIKELRAQERDLNESIKALDATLLEEKARREKYEERHSAITARTASYMRALTAVITNGQQEKSYDLPHTKATRRAFFAALALDAKEKRGDVDDYFIALERHFDKEERIARTSDITPARFTVKGEERDVEVLRIGRVYCALVAGDVVYPFIRSNGIFRLADNAPLNLAEKEAVFTAVRVLRGTTPPEYVALPVPNAHFGGIRATN